VAAAGRGWADLDADERAEALARLESEMRRAADELDFELAAQIRDQLMDLRASTPGRAGSTARPPGRTEGRRRGQRNRH
jgi:excinuclease UvrABC nuclease subunit